MKKNKKPTTALILSYKMLYENEIRASERISLIQNIPREFILCELATINYIIKPPRKTEQITSFNEQFSLALRFLRTNERIQEFKNSVNKIEYSREKPKEEFIIFNRATILFAMNELFREMTSSKFDNNYNASNEDWFSIFKYLMLVNDELDTENPKEEEKTKEKYSFEKIAARSVFINNLSIYDHQLLIFERFIYLCEFLEKDSVLSSPLKDYFNKIGLSHMDYVFAIASLYFKNDKREKDLHCHYLAKEGDQFEKIIKELSNRTSISKSNYDLIDLRKNPFLKITDNNYVLLDQQFLIDRLYNLFTADFFYEFIQPERKYKINFEQFRGRIGLFFEDYCLNIFERNLSETHTTFKKGNELMIKGKELSDLYFRYLKKVLIGQIKITNLSPSQLMGSLDDFYTKDREEFYVRFGLNQLARSLKEFISNPNNFEHSLDIKKRYHVYPVLVLNERAIMTMVVPKLFIQAFEDLISDLEIGKTIVHPLTIFHVSDIEFLDSSLNKKSIFKLIENSHKDYAIPVPISYVYNSIKLSFNREYKFEKHLKNLENEYQKKN